MAITTSIPGFIKELKRNGKKIATLKIMGSLEDYLVKEFCWVVSKNSKYFAVQNFGEKRQRVDICLLKLKKNGKKEICGLIEAKYLSNAKRISPDNAGNDSTIEKVLGRLKEQLYEAVRMAKSRTVRGWDIHLNSRNHYVYGLVFASFISNKRENEGGKEFFARVTDVAPKCGLKHHDSPRPYFSKVFDDLKVITPEGPRFVTLKIGLWVLKNR